jgi:HNH endonuclease
MQAGCSALPDRDAALGRYPRPRLETLLGWLDRLDRTQVHPVLGTPCWLWPGGLSGGYGHVTYRVEGRKKKVDAKLHILFYELFVGPVAPGLLLDHECRRRPCSNPDHLDPVTNQVNVIRGVHGRFHEAMAAAGQIRLELAA